MRALPLRQVTQPTAVLLAGLLLALLSACSAALPVFTPTAAPSATPPGITRQQAIDLATQDCWGFHMQLLDGPRNVRAQLTPLSDVARLSQRTLQFTAPLTASAWLVQMDATVHLVGGVLPTPGGPGDTPQPPFEAYCAALIDPTTGSVIGLSAGSK